MVTKFFVEACATPKPQTPSTVLHQTTDTKICCWSRTSIILVAHELVLERQFQYFFFVLIHVPCIFCYFVQ